MIVETSLIEPMSSMKIDLNDGSGAITETACESSDDSSVSSAESLVDSCVWYLQTKQSPLKRSSSSLSSLSSSLRRSTTSLVNSCPPPTSLRSQVSSGTFASADSSSVRSVSFADSSENRIVEIEHIAEMAEEQVKSVWYTNREIRDMKTTCKELAYKRAKGKFSESSKETFRGLEGRTHDANRKTSKMREEVMYAVLGEQHRQRYSKPLNMEKLASVCRPYTEECAKEARLRAVNDEKESKKYLSGRGFRRPAIFRRRSNFY